MRKSLFHSLKPLALFVVIGVFLVNVGALRPASADGLRFERGVNLIRLFSFARYNGSQPVWPPFDPAIRAVHTSEMLGALRKAGIDHVRIPLQVAVFLTVMPEQRRVLYDDLKHLIAQLQSQNLSVIVDLHPTESDRAYTPSKLLDALDGPNFTTYTRLVEEIATLLEPIRPRTVALELMNEPQRECRKSSGTDWLDFQRELYRRVRAISRDLPLFVTGGCFSNVEGAILINPDDYRDRNVYYSVHFYQPFQFTHQAALFRLDYLRGLVGLAYPASAGSAERTLELTRKRMNELTEFPEVRREAMFNQAAQFISYYYRAKYGPEKTFAVLALLKKWASEHQVPSDRIVFTEFGAWRYFDGGAEVDKASKLRWMADTVHHFRAEGWGWTYWVLRGCCFGITDKNGDGDRLDPEIAIALGLQP